MFIIKFTGTSIPFYLSSFGNATAYPSEAIKFDSIESAKSAISDGKTYQILDSQTLKWVAWVN